MVKSCRKKRNETKTQQPLETRTELLQNYLVHKRAVISEELSCVLSGWMECNVGMSHCYKMIMIGNS